MADRQTGKLAVILHADVAGSTDLVRQDEQLTHKRIQDTFRRFGETINKYHGAVRELRGDALLAEFERASDAVTAALAFQDNQLDYLANLTDTIQPTVRVGIAMGEVIIADDTITGEGVVLAQRLEQLAESGSVVIQGSAYEAIPGRFPFEYDNLGEHKVKGFDEPVRAYKARLKEETNLPQPAPTVQRTRNTIITFASVAVVAAGVALMWFKPWEPRVEPASVERMAFPLPNKPSIAVLPFDNLSGDQEHEYFSDGITNDIITDLSKFKGLFVIASNSTFIYKGKPVKVQQVAEDLGVRYVLEGSVQTTADRIRINAQLIDATSGRHLWAERYDRDAGDMFTIQNEIIETIVSTLAFRVEATERERALRKDTENLDAYDNYLRGTVELYRFTREAHAKAAKLYERAIELDPGYAKAISRLAWVHVNAYQYRWSEDPEASVKTALQLAQKAAALAPDDYFSYWTLGYIHLAQRDFDLAEAVYERARSLNPNDAEFLSIMATALLYLGRPDEAVEEIERAMRLNPHHPEITVANLGWAYYDAGRYEDAVKTYKSMNSPPPWVHRGLAAAYVQLGKLVEARSEIAQMLEKEPDYTLENFKVWPFKHKEDLERWIEDLRKAGVPEKPPLSLPDKPSIAVLPFDAYSDESEQKHFANGLTEDLTTALSRIPELFVIARTSTQKYKGKEVDVREVAKELGVGYILEGSIQKSGDNIRINAQLIDGVNGNHIWAKKYDRPAMDFFAIQDEIVRRILLEMQVKLTVGDHAKVASRGTTNLDAWLLTRQALAEGFTFTPEGMVRARKLLQEAHETDPDWSRPLAGVAWTHFEEVQSGWSKSPEESIKQGIKLAEQAIEVDPEDPLGYMQLGNLMTLEGEWDQGIALREKAIELAPNDFYALVGLGIMLIWYDEADRALEIYGRAKKVSPIVPWWLLAAESLALHMNGQHEQAIQRVKASMGGNPKVPRLYARLAAIYSDLGREEEAKNQMDMYLKAKPNATVATTMKLHTFKDQTRAEWYADLLRKAGLPD